jgi:colanic acid/amylovoran biosynthesis glycosyltransferase
MTLGLPVVATRHAGIPEIVSDMTTGLLVPEADSEALARAIQTISNDPDLARRMRDAAYADVRVRFDARRQSELLERRLLELAGL